MWRGVSEENHLIFNVVQVTYSLLEISILTFVSVAPAFFSYHHHHHHLYYTLNAELKTIKQHTSNNQSLKKRKKNTHTA